MRGTQESIRSILQSDAFRIASLAAHRTLLNFTLRIPAEPPGLGDTAYHKKQVWPNLHYSFEYIHVHAAKNNFPIIFSEGKTNAMPTKPRQARMFQHILQ